MRLSLEEKKYLHKILDHLTDESGCYHATAFEREHLAFPLFRKFEQELTGV